MKEPTKEMLTAISESNLDTIQDLLTVVDEITVYKLLQAYSGTTLTFPRIDTIFKKIRNDRILEDFYAGISVKRLARKYNISERQTRLIIANYKKGIY